MGAACQFLLSPFIALAIISVFNLEPGIKIGLVLIAAMPSGSLPKLFSYFGRGNLVLSASLDAFGTLASLVSVPLLMSLLVVGYLPTDFKVPFGLVMTHLILFLVSPLFIGMALARTWPEHRQLIPKWCFRIGTTIVGVMIIGSVGCGRASPFAQGWQALVAVILFCVLSQQLSMRPFRLLRWPRANRLSIGLDVTMRNINLALAVLAIMRQTLLERQQALGLTTLDDRVEGVLAGVFWAILVYAAVAAVAGFLVALQFRYAPPDPNAQTTATDPPAPAVAEAGVAQASTK
jgi:BASS family bile acid:Na+ symporter